MWSVKGRRVLGHAEALVTLHQNFLGKAYASRGGGLLLMQSVPEARVCHTGMSGALPSLP